MSSLASRHAVVTGGSRGIGLAVARALAQAGALVTLVARNSERLRTAVASLPSVPHAPHSGVACDLADPERVEDMWASHAALAATLILVNSAGVAQSLLLARTPAADIVAMVNTNFTSAAVMSRCAVRAMLRSKTPGDIVSLLSALAHRGVPGTSVYAGTKGALVSFSQALAAEVASRNIRVNTVLPGLVASTDMGRTVLGLGAAAVPLDAVVQAVFQLVAAPGVSGTCVHVDNGWADV